MGTELPDKIASLTTEQARPVEIGIQANNSLWAKLEPYTHENIHEQYDGLDAIAAALPHEIHIKAPPGTSVKIGENCSYPVQGKCFMCLIQPTRNGLYAHIGCDIYLSIQLSGRLLELWQQYYDKTPDIPAASAIAFYNLMGLLSDTTQPVIDAVVLDECGVPVLVHSYTCAVVTRPCSLSITEQLPVHMTQYTYEECRYVCSAFSGSLASWSYSCDDNAGLCAEHHSDSHFVCQLQFRRILLDGPLSGANLRTTSDAKKLLEQKYFDRIMLLQLMQQAAILKTDEPVLLDEFVNKLFDCRSKLERQKMRAWVWDNMRIWCAIRLHGKRGGRKWTDVTSAENPRPELELTFRGEPLISITDYSTVWSDGPETPFAVGFNMGLVGKAAKKNPAILTYFGSLDAVLAIPAGRIAGAWARCILYTLQQKWRECAKGATVDAEQSASQRYIFTRRQLLCGLFQPNPEFSLTTLLASKHAVRAIEYFDAAMKILMPNCGGGQVESYEELGEVPGVRRGPSNRWEDWLDQKLVIRPCDKYQKDALAIADSAQRHNRKRQRRSKPQKKAAN